MSTRKGTKRPKRPTAHASPLSSPLDRSYAQKIRSDRNLTFESAAKRAAFWAKQQRLVQAEEQHYMEAMVASLSNNSPRLNSQFASANISAATLESPSPGIPSEGPTVAGLSESGMIPPPPPVL